jgi:hypothetical protein
LAIIRPTLGPAPASGLLPRRTCTMTSGCTLRIPCFTVVSNSVDRLMRLRAGSTAKKPGVAIRQIMRDGPCGADSTRSSVQRGCASAGENHARGLGAGYSAGRSACPWPRDSPRLIRLKISEPSGRSRFASTSVRVVLLLAGAVPQYLFDGSQPYRRLSGDCLRVLTRLPRVKPGLRQRTHIKRKSKHSLSRRQPGTISAVTERNPKEPNWNAAERLAAARKTVSFGQCRFRLERRSTTKRGWRID